MGIWAREGTKNAFGKFGVPYSGSALPRREPLRPAPRSSGPTETNAKSSRVRKPGLREARSTGRQFHVEHPEARSTERPSNHHKFKRLDRYKSKRRQAQPSPRPVPRTGSARRHYKNFM